MMREISSTLKGGVGKGGGGGGRGEGGNWEARKERGERWAWVGL